MIQKEKLNKKQISRCKGHLHQWEKGDCGAEPLPARGQARLLGHEGSITASLKGRKRRQIRNSLLGHGHAKEKPRKAGRRKMSPRGSGNSLDGAGWRGRGRCWGEGTPQWSPCTRLRVWCVAGSSWPLQGVTDPGKPPPGHSARPPCWSPHGVPKVTS